MAKKPRKKSYRPRDAKPNKVLFRKLPISPDIAKGLMNKVLTELIGMRMTEKNEHDLYSALIFFGVAWKAADQMENTDELREVFEGAIEAIEKDLETDGALQPETLDVCSKAAPLGYEVMIRISTEEYLEFSSSMRDDGACPLADRVFEAIRDAAKAGRIPSGEAPQ